MTKIANQWTGDGIAEDTGLTSSNVATAGNFTGSGVTWTLARGTNPTPNTLIYKNHGFRFAGATGAIANVAGAFSAATGLRTQMKVTIGDITTATAEILQIRNTEGSGGRSGGISIDVNRQITMTDAKYAVIGGKAPALAIGDIVVIDMVLAIDASPTTTNGRLFYRIKNLTNTAWNTSGEFFYDALYTVNAGLTPFTNIHGGEVGGGALGATNLWDFEFLGAEPVTVSSSDTSASAAKAYFADSPVVSTPLSTPVVTLGAKTTPTSVGGSDGTQVATWPAVTGAASYDAFVSGSATPAQEEFVRVGTNVTSPYTFTGLNPGQHAYGIKAKV